MNYSQRLQEDIKKYSIQIGILPEDIPRLVTSRIKMTQIILDHRPDDYYYLDKINRRMRRKFEGVWFPQWNIIYVNVTIPRRDTYNRDSLIMDDEVIYSQFKETLVHELVHCRFPELKHGKYCYSSYSNTTFNRRVKQILKGKTFEPKLINRIPWSSVYEPRYKVTAS
jgi:hypothetical protein